MDYKRAVVIDIQVIAYLGDYLNMYKKSLKTISSQMCQEHVQTSPANTASSHNPS